MSPDASDPPLVDLKVTNPVTYIKSWWAKIIGNEGVEVRLRVKPLTAIAIALAISAVSFGVGNIVTPVSLSIFGYKFSPPVSAEASPKPTSTPEDLWIETAFTGKLQFAATTSKYYLITTSSQAINLEVPNEVRMVELVGKRIFVAGSYNKDTKTLKVTDIKNMEVLPKLPVAIPTSTPKLNPTQSPLPSATPDQTPLESPLN